MLKAYIDDSHMRQAPFYVLGGWVAPVKAWAAFSDAWRDVLRMSPRIEYFKYDEAMGLSGEFLGISEAARDEKLRLLINLIEEHELVGLASAVPHSVFYPMFGTYPHKWVRNPYYISFYGIAARLVTYLSKSGTKEKVEFIFDFQPGSDQMREAQEGWENFREMAPPEMLDYVQVHRRRLDGVVRLARPTREMVGRSGCQKPAGGSPGGLHGTVHGRPCDTSEFGCESLFRVPRLHTGGSAHLSERVSGKIPVRS
jgi:hypothetical protein